MLVFKLLLFLANLFFWFVLTVFFALNEPFFIACISGGIMFFLCFFYFYRFFFKTDAMTFFSTDWEYFKKRLKWSNSIAFTFAIVLFFIMIGFK
ncbi:hypothetical protein MCEGE10_02459 [Flavobacteriaceae bacterium]